VIVADALGYGRTDCYCAANAQCGFLKAVNGEFQ
jgi:hypothetical protein